MPTIARNFDVSDVSEAVPFDIIQENTLTIGRDPDLDLLNKMLTVEERTALRLILEKYGSYQRHKRMWSHHALRNELECIRSLLTMFEIFAASEDAKAQLTIWQQKVY